MKKITFFLGSIILVLIFGCNSKLESQNSGGNTQLDTTIIARGLEVPWEILWGPDNYIWVTERPGRVLRINPDTKVRKQILHVNVETQGESGLLGMALHPDFPQTPTVYLVYTYLDAGNIKERLVSYTYQQDSLINETILINNITGNTYHDGSRLIFGPDNKLYMSTGEAGNMPLAQDTTSLNGKILRINPDGSVPDDNPIHGSYVFTLGHRNPQGLDFAPSGIFYESEHGPDTDDEINIIETGRNYGWPTVRGMCDLPEELDFCTQYNVKEPIAHYTPTLAVAGIAYYKYNLIPEWTNSLIVTSLKAGKLMVLKLDDQGLTITGTTIVYDNTLGRLRDVCVSNTGRLFFSTSNRDGRGTPREGDDKIIEIKPSSTNSISKPDKSTGLNIYPNPAKGKLRADINTDYQNGFFSIYDLMGNLKIKGNNSQLSQGIDVSNLSSGLYNIQIHNGTKYASASLVIL